MKDVFDMPQGSPFTPIHHWSEFERKDETDTLVVFEPEQIHILGSKQDINMFKEFVKKENSTGIVEEPLFTELDKLSSVISKITFEEEQSSGYRERTMKNASADATIAIAIDFSTAGEILTKKSVLNQKNKYIPIQLTTLSITDDLIDSIVTELNTINKIFGIELNIAGNGIYTFKNKITQQQLDDYVYNILHKVINSPRLNTKINSTRSGGQTGIDEAGAKASIKLGLPTTVLAPLGWKFRDINSRDITDEKKFKERFDIKSDVTVSKPTFDTSMFTTKPEDFTEGDVIESYALDTKIKDIAYHGTSKDFTSFVQGKQFHKLTAEEKAKTIEQVTKEHRSITALKDLSTKLAHRIGGKIEFENHPNVDWKGYNQGNTSVLNEAYMTSDTPFHEVLAHPIVRELKKSKPELYNSLLKELETGIGKEVLDRVKRDYKYKDLNYVQKGQEVYLDNTIVAAFFDEKNAEDYIKEKSKYTLEEQQEEAIVTLLGLMAADKLDAKKDATLISKLKELWKQVSDFVKSLLRQDGIKIDELPITTTLNDLAEIMAYGNNKIILPGYKVEYSTPLGNKYDTLEEVNQEIRGLADANVEVDLSDIKVKMITQIPLKL